MTQRSTSRPSLPEHAAEQPTREDRLLAAAAYLGYLAGLWLIVPIVIYVLRRERSRFVAHHAMHAILLNLALVPLSLLCTLAAILLGLVGLAASDAGLPVLIYLCVVWGSWLLPLLLYVVVTLLAAHRAFKGRIDDRSRVARLAARLLR